ncbi:MAG TPA: histidine kinase [Burkholderiaceae bacterium]|nr:histidine kinase [Burkholderiaceae bacterium]
MSTATPHALAPAGAARTLWVTLANWRDAIASLKPAAWKWAGVIALFGTVVDCALVFGERQPSAPTSAVLAVCIANGIVWITQVPLGLCAWAIADRSGVDPDKRVRRLAVALVVATLVQAALVPALSDLAVGRLDFCAVFGCHEIDYSKIPSWLLYAEASGHMLIFGGLMFACLEARQRNREIEQRLLASQQERARLRRSAFDARLTAMRAQIDPQFLFDSLADVQTAYATDTVRGASTLDLLIAYLRTALPRLRTEGSTIAAEAELVDAWLAVVAARRGGVPLRRVVVEPACASAPFPATVLLPLIQWAVGEAAQATSDVSLLVRRAQPNGAGQLLVQLRVTPGRPCREDEPELRRIRDRLQAMYGGAVELSCSGGPSNDQVGGDRSAPATVIALRWPDENADRDRR